MAFEKPILHHGGHAGEPVPAADLRAWALPRAGRCGKPAGEAAGDLAEAKVLSEAVAAPSAGQGRAPPGRARLRSGAASAADYRKHRSQAGDAERQPGR